MREIRLLKENNSSNDIYFLIGLMNHTMLWKFFFFLIFNENKTLETGGSKNKGVVLGNTLPTKRWQNWSASQ